jgi:hypothetical protein
MRWARSFLLTFAGQAVTFLDPVVKIPYSLRWNIGFQQSLTKDMMLEVVYIGNHSVHLPIDYTRASWGGILRRTETPQPRGRLSGSANLTRVKMWSAARINIDRRQRSEHNQCRFREQFPRSMSGAHYSDAQLSYYVVKVTPGGTPESQGPK